jgi:hypothetical protein
MPAYFFRSEPGAAELRRLARREGGRVCQRVLMIANLLEGMEHVRRCRLAQQPWTGGARQYHFVSVAALQPGAQSSGADLALSAQPLARQLGIPSLAAIMDACETAWNRFAADHALIRSLCAVGWAPPSSAP